MKVKSVPVLASLLAVGISAGALPARADQEAVTRTKKLVEDFANRQGSIHPSYPAQLHRLALTYLQNGNRKEADETFEKAIQLAQKLPDADKEVTKFTLAYAVNLASRKEDVKAVEKLIARGKETAKKLPPSSKERIDFLFATAEVYKMLALKSEEDASIKALDEHLKTLENNDKLTNEEITTLAYSLTRLAGLYVPAPRLFALRMMPPAEVIDDNAPAKKGAVRMKDFKVAEGYQMRAIAQYNRLPANVPWRIEAQRSLVLWFRHFGQKKQEEIQTQNLSKLMKTSDPNQLFPAPAPCPACGMG